MPLFLSSVPLSLYETPAHPRFWLVESLLPLFKPLRFHGINFVLRRFSLGSPICASLYLRFHAGSVVKTEFHSLG